MVAAACWASTTRHASPAHGAALAASAVGVQVIDDMHQALRAEDEFARGAVEAEVLARQPGARGLVAADDRLQRAEQADQQQPEFAGLAVRGELQLALAQAGDAGRAQAQDPAQRGLGQVEQVGGAQDRLGQHGSRVGRGGEAGTDTRAGHGKPPFNRKDSSQRFQMQSGWRAAAFRHWSLSGTPPISSLRTSSLKVRLPWARSPTSSSSAGSSRSPWSSTPMLSIAKIERGSRKGGPPRSGA